jgi:hypothetical protein
MKSLDFGRYVLGGFAVAVMLAGCGGSQPPIGAPGSMPQNGAIDTQAKHNGSWMLPEAKRKNLLYVSTSGHGIYAFTYPEGKLVGQLETGSADGLCSDGNGNVFVVQFGAQEVLEYSHGSKEPNNTLNDSGNYPWACAIDPTTGNLAVVGGNGVPSDPENVAIFANASGSPTVHTYYTGLFIWCAYDNQGNLFITTGDTYYGSLFELAIGSATLTQIAVDKMFGDNAPLQWDGKYLALEDAPKCCPRHTWSPMTIYQLQISGSTGTVVNTIALDKSTNRSRVYDYGVQFWIQGGGTVIAPGTHDNEVGLWRYPTGGSPVRKIAVARDIYGVTVSLAAK